MKPENEPISVPTESRPTQFQDTAEKLARSLGHKMNCAFTGCTCGAGEEQAIALYEYERLKRAASSSLLPVPSPLVDALQHGMNCPGLTPTQKDECTCGFEWRVRLRTEQEMHRAWKKRAEEAEAKLASLPAGESTPKIK